MISVIIPLYNVEKYILQCLVSFEKQIYRDFELIIVDDGSTDKSVELIEEYQKKSSLKIKLIKQKNAGVSAARNVGLANANGDYICFVDSDDIVAPEFLSEMEYHVKLDEMDLVVCGFKSVPQNWGLDSYRFEEGTTITMSSNDLLRKFLYHDIKISICSLMVKKSILKLNNIKFTEGFRYSEDVEMVWKIIAHSNKVTYLSSKLYFYRVRNDSAMSLVDDKRIDGFRLITGLEAYFKNNRPDFAHEFKRFATARWVWATMWQIAVASSDYKAFKSKVKKFNTRRNMRKLILYPKKYVAFSALMYWLFPYIYYKIASIKGVKRLNDRRVTNIDKSESFN